MMISRFYFCFGIILLFLSTSLLGADDLVFASRKNDVSKVKQCIAEGMHPDQEDELTNTALMWAASNGNIEIAEFLITAGADSNKKRHRGDGFDGFTPLCFALHAKQVSIIPLLLSKTDLNRLDVNPLSIAISSACDEGIQYILSAGISQSYKNEALAFALSKDRIDIFRLLLENGADINAEIIARDGRSYSILQCAVLTKETAMVQLVLSAGASINKVTSNKSTALSLAAEIGADKIVRLLIDAGSDVDAGRALKLAASNGHNFIISLLLKAGADPQYVEGADLITPFMAAKLNNHDDAAMLLKNYIIAQHEGDEQRAAEIMLTKEIAYMETQSNIISSNVCPMLSAQVSEITHDLFAKMKAPQNLKIYFENSDDVNLCGAYTRVDRREIYLGFGLIKKVFLEASADQKILFKSFLRNIIAHEVGHNIDPEFDAGHHDMCDPWWLYAMCDAFKNIGYAAPLWLLALASSDAQIEHVLTLFASTATITAFLSKVVYPLRRKSISRSLECNADRLSLRGLDDVKEAADDWEKLFQELDCHLKSELKVAARAMLEGIKGGVRDASPLACAKAAFKHGKKIFGIVANLYTPNIFRTHPTADRRVANIRKHADAMLASE